MIVFCPHCNTRMNLAEVTGEKAIFCARCDREIATPEELNRSPRVVVMTPAGRKETYRIGNGLSIGRDPGNSIQLLDGQVSRRHATIDRRGDKCTITDAGSRNGSFVNGERLTREHVLSQTDHIRLGGFIVRYFDGVSQDAVDMSPGLLQDPADLGVPVDAPTTARGQIVRLIEAPPPAPAPAKGTRAPLALPDVDAGVQVAAVVPVPGGPPSWESGTKLAAAPATPASASAQAPGVGAAVRGFAMAPSGPISDPLNRPLAVPGPRPQGILSPVAGGKIAANELPEGGDWVSLAEVEVPSTNSLSGRKIESREGPVLQKEYNKLLLAFRVNEELKNIQNLPKLLKRAMDVIFELFPVTRGAILLQDDSGQMVPNIVKRRDGGESLAGVRLSRTLLKRAEAERKSILTRDALRAVGTASVLIEDINSAMTVPLIARGTLLGILHVDSSSAAGGSFTREDLEILTGIGTQIALAIDDTILFRKMERETEARRRLGRYMSPGLVEQIVSNQVQMEKGGANRRATILFSDIRGFTTMAELLSPEQVMNMLNEYFELMVDIVFKYNGILDKFIGDALMAIWGVPVAGKSDVFDAVRAALEMQTELEHFNERRKSLGEPSILVGIGINTGEVIAGNIGSSKRMEYTVLGDNVNVASRICGAAKGQEILISEESYDEIRDQVKVEPMPPAKLKGKSTEVKLHRVLGLFQEAKPGSERRTSERMDVAFSVRWSRAEGPEKFHGTVDNISSGGCLLKVEMQSEGAFRFNDLLTFDFESPAGDKVIGLPGRVVGLKYTCNARSNVYYELNIQFANPTFEQTAVLKKATARSGDGN